MTAEHHALEFFNSLYVLLVLVNFRPANCDSLMELGQSSTSCNILSVSREMLTNVGVLVIHVFRSVTFDPFETKVVLRTIFFSVFLDNFHNAFFQRRQQYNDGLDFVCQNSFLRCGQVNSVLYILLRSSMNLMIHIPRFLCICNHFCFAGIVVETNCTHLTVEDKLHLHGIGNVLSSSCTSEAGFYPHREGIVFPMHASSSFQRCSNLVSHTRDLPR